MPTMTKMKPKIRLAPLASIGTAERYRQIQMKQCRRFHQASTDGYLSPGNEAYSHMCECGEAYQFHDTEAQYSGRLDPDTPWSPNNDTNLVQTNAYGEIKMAGLMTVRCSKFIRVADTEARAILDLIANEWQLEAPDFIILLTGDLKNLDRDIREGISEACTSVQPRVWVVGDGFNPVVMDHVWDKFSHYEVRPLVIGVAPWGQVALKKLLFDEMGRGKWPASYLHAGHRPGQAVDFSSMVNASEFSLNKSYSHFLLVDNGTVCKVSDVSPFIINLLKEVQNKFKTRVVTVLNAGDHETLRLVKEVMNIDGGGQNPTVVIKHSGGAADIVTRIMDTSRRLKSQKSIESALKSTYPDLSEDSFLYQVSLARYGLCRLVNQHNRHHDLSSTIVNANFATMELQERFDHAIKWNRPDIACDLIKKEIHHGHEWVDYLIRSALDSNQPDFLIPILSLDLPIQINTDAITLQKLYNSVPKSNLLPKLLRVQRKKHTGCVASCCNKCPGKEEDGVFSLPEVAELMISLIGNFYKPLYSKSQYKKVRSGSNFELRGEGAREIMIWAVMNHHAELALKLWTKVNNPIAAALTATNLLRSLSQYNQNYAEKRAYLDTADKFELLARDVLDACYKYELEHGLDEPCTEYTLIRQRDTFGHTTCLRLALTGHCQQFIEHPSVQTLLDKVWFGQISFDNESWKVALCIFCPLLIYPVIYFRMDTERKKTRPKLPTMTSNLDIHKTDSAISCDVVRRMVHFCRAPVVNFSYNCISYFIFLLLFSYTLLSDYDPDEWPSRGEMVLSGWIGTMMCEELRQMIMERSNYLQHPTNWLDVGAILLYIIAMGLRLTGVMAEASRYTMCFSLTLFYIRLLHIFAVFRNLGPLLVMIVKMLKDLISFMFFIAVFFTAYGVVWHSILYPNTPISGLMLYSILRSAYWPMHGEVQAFLDETETGTCVMRNGSLGACTTAQLIAPPLLAMYILFVNILMFNLLIALFSYRFSQIKPVTKTIWSTLRYTLIREYYGRPPLPPPFIIICHLLQVSLYIIKMVLRCAAKCSGKPNLGRSICEYQWLWDRDIYILFGTGDTSELSSWEYRNADKYNRAKEALLQLKRRENKRRSRPETNRETGIDFISEIGIMAQTVQGEPEHNTRETEHLTKEMAHEPGISESNTRFYV